MDFNIRTRSISLIIILLVTAGNIWSQVPVETSNQKVIISGTPYFIHIVKKGQTAYSIARAYGITVSELTKENPPALYGVKENQSLRIPVKTQPDQPSSVQNTSRDENRFVYHRLNAGETIYSLSRTFGVSENEIIQSNPGIDITKLAIGAEIAVPRREFMTEREKFNDQEKKYIYHKVEKGETLSSIAEKYGVSVRVLRRENRNLRFPQVGDFIRVPGDKIQQEVQAEVPAPDTVPAVVEEPVVKLERPAGFTPVRELEGTMDVAVLLPFYIRENGNRREVDSSRIIKGKRQYKVTRKPEDWIYPQSIDFVEMYAGILMAADTLRSLGLDLNINTYDIKDDTLGVTKLIRSGKLDGMDLIIGPVYSRNLNIVSRYAKAHGIPVVSPVALINNSVLNGNPTLFMANPSLEVAQQALARKTAEDYGNNLVFIHADSARIDPEVKKFRDLIFTELTYKIPYEEIKFKEFTFYSRSTFGNDSIIRLSHALNENIENTVIIASEDPPVVSEIVTVMHGLSRKFDIKLYAYPSITFLDNLDPKLFFDLNMLILSHYWADYSRRNVKQFNLNYRKKFLTMPLEHSYAWMGYDIGYYFISGLAMHGDVFIGHPEIHNPELLQNAFEFERSDLNNGFENKKLFNVRYSKDYRLELVE